MNLDWQLIWIWAITIGYAALIIPVLRVGKTRLPSILLTTYAVLSILWTWAAWLSSSALEGRWRTVTHIGQTYGAVLLPTVLGMLTTTFLSQKPRGMSTWLALGGVTTVVMAVLDGMDARWTAGVGGSALRVTKTLSLAGWIVLFGTAYASSWSRYRRTQRPLHRNRWRYWMIVLIMILCGDALFITADFPYNALGTLLRWSGTALGGVVLLSHYLPDLAGFARGSLRYILLTLGTAWLFFGGVYLARYIAQSIAGIRGVLLGTAGGAFLLAVLYPPFHRWTQSTIDRLVFGKGYDQERILREYGQAISNVLDLDRLVKAAVDTIGETMGVASGALLVYEDSPPALRVISGLGDVRADRIALEADSPFVAHLSQAGTPLSQVDIDVLPRFEDLRPEERAWLASLNVDIYVPIRTQDQLLGVWAMGAKKPGDSYTPADVALLRRLASQTTVTLKNARLVEDLKRLNAAITRLNQDLSATNERLAVLDRTKSDFISIASHELKTPLTQVRGYTDIILEMCQEGTISPSSIERLGQGISRGARRLQTIVDEMLDVALIEAEEFSIHPVTTSLRDVLEQVIAGLESALRERRQSLTATGLDDLPDIIADGTRLHQAFRNIVANGIKVTPDEGRIDIHAVQSGDTVKISIADTGIGIDPEHQNLIFVKFYRVGELNLHSSGQTKFKGAGPGLGLPIAKGIIEAHGGRIWVESSGHNEATCPGSTFYVALPVNGTPLRGADSV